MSYRHKFRTRVTYGQDSTTGYIQISTHIKADEGRLAEADLRQQGLRILARVIARKHLQNKGRKPGVGQGTDCGNKARYEE